MEILVFVALALGALWVFIGLPQQRRVKAHQQMVDSLAVGDEVILSAGVYGRIVDLGPETAQVEIAPGVVVKAARMAVLRRVEDARPEAADKDGADGHEGYGTEERGADEGPPDGKSDD
jgi:preprotein translocase subunit YajC